MVIIELKQKVLKNEQGVKKVNNAVYTTVNRKIKKRNYQKNIMKSYISEEQDNA